MRPDSPHRRTTLLAVITAVLVAGVALVLTTSLREAADGSDDTPAATRPAAATPTAAPGSPTARARQVLREWDRARAAAWADGDADALAALYADGAAAGEQDVRMLRRWTDRGLRVRDLRMQVLRVDVRAHTDRRLVLVVTDRLAGAVAVRPTDGEEWTLPTDRPSTRRLVFRRTSQRWLLASVTERPAAPARSDG